MELKRVVVTGLGTINPLGNTVSEYWESLKNGVSGACPITRFNAEKFKTRFACEVKNYDPNNYFDRKEVKKLDRYAQFAMIAADEAVKDAGIAETTEKERTGVIWASGIGGMETLSEEFKAYFTGDGTPRFGPFFVPKMISDIAAGMISMKYGFMGPNFGTVSACASASNAIIDATSYIRLGYADTIVTGGSEASITEAAMGGFNSAQALSTRNDDYKTASRPFCKTRDGFVMGEGGAALILEEYEHAKNRGAKIYCEVIGVGLSADAYHMTAPHPDGLGAMLVMRNALKDAKISTSEVDYINVHGTATPLGDIAETKSIVNVFGADSYKLNISSTKSMHGHLLGASGAIEALAAILAMKYNTVPPTINMVEREDQIDPNLKLTFHKAEERTVNCALSNTFGFGGHNTCIIFRKI